MTDLAATFLRSLREALSRVALQPDATVTSQVSADYVRVELRQGGLVLAAGTVHRSGVPSTARQVELPLEAPATTRQVELPAPAAAPPDASELVELVMPNAPDRFDGLDLYDPATIVAWTWSGERPDEHLRTIVPRTIADELLRRSRGRIDAERVSVARGLPSHVLTIGGEVATVEAGPVKILGVVGGSEGSEGAPGLVVQMPDGPRVAWVDGFDMRDGVVTAYPSLSYKAQETNGVWSVRRNDPPEPPRPLPPKKSAPKKAPKASAAAKAVAEIESHEAAKRKDVTNE